MFKHKPLVFAFIFFIALTLLSINIPFFWDGIFFLKTANFFYNTSYSTLIPPIDFDTGNFPLFGIYLSAFWKFFGKSLLVSHIAILPFLLGIAFEYYRLAKRYIPKNLIFLSIIFLCIEPTFITQSIIVAYDIILVYFYLLSLNLILQNKTKFLWLALIFLAFSSMRGIVAEVSLFLFFILNSKISIEKLQTKKIFIAFFTSLVFLCIWTFYHFIKTDWAIFSPQRRETHEEIVGFGMFFRQIIFSIWKLADFGRIFLLIFILLMVFICYRKRNISKKTKEVLLIISIPTIVFILFFSLFSNPIGHRYFLVPILLLLIGVSHFLSKIENSKIRVTLFSLLSILLITGNFWIYPEKYGNGWDCSLKILPYFEIHRDFVNYVEMKKIDPQKIGTGFPLFNDYKFSYLQPESYAFADKNIKHIENFDYILQSNICNDFSEKEIEDLRNKWKLEKEFRKCQIYFRFYSKIK